MGWSETQEKVEGASEVIDSTNIFDEFAWDEKLKAELKESELKQKKSIYNYLGTVNILLRFINFAFFLTFIWAFGYIYIQNSEDMYNTSYLNPFCNILLPIEVDEENCSSVTSLIWKVSAKKIEDNEKYYTEILSSVWDAYTISNFVFSKEVMFLLDKSENRIKPLEFLEEFNRLKTKFQPRTKTKLQCANIEMNASWKVIMECTAYSSDWDSDIVWSSWDPDSGDVWGSSISLASSFINFLEKNSAEFEVLDKPKIFKIEDVVWEWANTKKTSFKLTLKSKRANISLLK